MSIGKKFLSALLEEGSVSNFLQYGPIDDLFRGTEIEAFKFVKGFVKQYHKFPEPETIKAHTGEDLVSHEEPSAYYVDLMKQRHSELQLKRAMKKATEYLSPDVKDINAALRVITQTVMDLINRENAKQMVDFRDAYDAVIAEYVQKFTADESRGFQMGWPTLDEMAGGIGVGDLISFVGRPAMGKALAHGTPVLMSDGGFKPIEDIEVGDALASVDGAPSKVFGVYAQGERELYRVTFADGRSLDVDGDHLWQVGCKYWDAPRIMTTKDMIRFRSKASRYANTLWVPLASGEFGDAKPYIDPYLLGVLLGDGCLTKEVSFTSVDPEVVRRVEAALPPTHCLTEIKSEDRAPSYRVVTAADQGKLPPNEVKARLQKLGLWGLKSKDKFLPQHVFHWCRDDRVALLQGLMDTDGTADKNGCTVFGSSSQRLVEDVARLVRSIGGKALHQKVKATTHLDHHRITIILKAPEEAFSMQRKKARCTAYTTHDPSHLRVTGIEPIGSGPATCIAVTHPSRLFIAGDYVVTHNTWFLLYAALNGWLKAGKNQDKENPQSRMFVSMEMPISQIQQRLAAIVAQVPAGAIKNPNLSTMKLAKLKNSLLEIQGFGEPFYVIDGNLTATVEDIWMLARQLKPAAILIDGGYLVKHPTERDRYRRVAENADLMKQELAALAPTAVSWQFAKSASKKKKGEKVTGDDVGYSDAIFQVSSLLLGLFEEDSVETLQQRKIEILKGRGGEVGSFRTKWDFQNMDFSEIEDEDVEELQFL